MRATRALGIAFTVVICAFGVFLGWKGLGNIRRASVSESWPKTEATVTRSAIQSTTTHDRSDRTASTSYSASLEFRYRVNGASHTTSTRHFGQTEGSTDSSDAELLRLRYPEGAKVTVFYDPAHPDIAVAEPGFYAELLWLPAAGLFIVFPALMFLALLLSHSRPGLFDLGIVMFGSIFASLGLIGLSYGGIQIVRARDSVAWPRTQGEIVYGKIDTSESVTRGEVVTTRETSYGAHLVYRYAIHGQTYFSNQRRFGQLSGADEEWAAGIAAKYPRGSTLPVAYSPANPGLAVLEPGFDSESLWLPGAGLAAFLFGLSVIVFARRALSPARFAASPTEKHKRYH